MMRYSKVYSDGVTPASNLPNFMADLGARLVDNGYSILPIGPGTKYPGDFRDGIWQGGLNGWQSHCSRDTRPFEVERWSKWPGCGIGIAAGNVVAFDIDVFDAEVALAIEKAARRELGDTPALRIGEAPKRILVYRTEKPFKGIKRHPLEVIGFGQQFVAYAIHPNTGQPYAWPHEGLDEVDVSRLPLVSEEQMNRFVEGAVKMLPEGLRKGTHRPERNKELYSNPWGDPRGTVEAMTAAMEWVPNDDEAYDYWVAIGYSLKVGIGEAGWSLFDAWSQKSPSKYDAAYTWKTWKSLKPNGQISCGTVYDAAMLHGWVPEGGMVLNGAVAEALKSGNPAAEFLAKLHKERIEHDPETGEVYEPEQLPAPDIKVEVDSLLATVGGTLADMVDWMTATAYSPQPWLALGASIATIGALMGHKYRLVHQGNDTRSNVQIVAFAPSGSGKDHARKCVMKALRHAGLKDYLHAPGLASAQGLMGSLSNFFAGVSLIDEAGHFFGNIMNDRSPTHLREIGRKLMLLATGANDVIEDDARASVRDQNAVRYDIPHPCYCLYATTVPEPFWAAMGTGETNDGFLARILMMQSPLNYPAPSRETERVEARLDDIAGQLRRIVVGPGVEVTDLGVTHAVGKMKPIWQGEPPRQTRVIHEPTVPEVAVTADGDEAIWDIALDEHKKKVETDGKTAASTILARTVEHTKRIALIRAVSRDPHFPKVTGDDVRWAHAFVRLSQRIMIPSIDEHVSDTAWEGTLKKVYAVIKKHGDWMDGTTLSKRIQFLKLKERQEAIVQLVEGGKLITRQEQTKTKPKLYIKAC